MFRKILVADEPSHTKAVPKASQSRSENVNSASEDEVARVVASPPSKPRPKPRPVAKVRETVPVSREGDDDNDIEFVSMSPSKGKATDINTAPETEAHTVKKGKKSSKAPMEPINGLEPSQSSQPEKGKGKSKAGKDAPPLFLEDDDDDNAQALDSHQRTKKRPRPKPSSNGKGERECKPNASLWANPIFRNSGRRGIWGEIEEKQTI